MTPIEILPRLIYKKLFFITATRVYKLEYRLHII